MIGPLYECDVSIPTTRRGFNERLDDTSADDRTTPACKTSSTGIERLFVLTGAGCSTRSGIPDYRDADGQWKRAQPVTYQAFMGEEKTRRRYWARSLIGWRLIRQAAAQRRASRFGRLEAMGRTELLLTQNVDRLHQAAGSAQVIDLHGRIDLVRCMDCERRSPRDELQDELGRLNADWLDLDATEAPDGDADLEGADFSTFVIPSCRALRRRAQA